LVSTDREVLHGAIGGGAVGEYRERELLQGAAVG